MNILVAEDDEGILRFAHATLEGDGHTVFCAHDGSEALAISQNCEGRIDLLLSDIGMPRMDGIELCAAIRRDRPHIAVLLTDFEMPAGRTKPPFAYFLKKPFLPWDLVAAVRRSFGPDANAAAASCGARVP